MKLLYGLKNGQLLHVSQVEKGLKCGCICPACKTKLVARKGTIKTHHFAHYREDCPHSLETTLHMVAKEILQKAKKITIPPVQVKFDSYKDPWVISKEQTIVFEEAKLKHRQNDIIPDVILYLKGTPLIVEIAVTHKIDENKLMKIKRMGISVLEISIPDREITMEELQQLVVSDTENKKWIYNVRAEQILKKVLNSAERKDIVQRGFATHVDYCYIRARVWKGKPYANVIDDCINCEYCVDGHPMKGTVYCTARIGIKTYEDFLNYLKSPGINS